VNDALLSAHFPHLPTIQPELCGTTNTEPPVSADIKASHSQRIAVGWHVQAIWDSPYRKQKSAAT
jgi:hypothetical protein